jgi:hypothetical protein
MEVAWVDTPEEWRDLFIMMYCVAGTITFLAAIIFTIVTGYLSTATLIKTRSVVTNNLAPALENVRDTTSNVRGTVSFVSENAVKPVVRVYSTYAGARQFMTVMARVARRRGGSS